ncbi:PKD domain-containing protein, partial [bacterium]|nr:PKD domain-containing protein [bacterium]
VFLPAGTTGSFTVTVDAASIGGDGVPGNGDTTDQDFALIVYNGSTGPVGPNASFFGSPTSGNAPLSVNFTDTSSGGPTAWSWTFGDGGTSSAQNPSHTYVNPGSYSVTLAITAPGGSDSTTLTNYINVSAPPAPGIADGSFELQTAGAAPTTPWSVSGSGHVVNPAGGTTSDSGMPTNGTNWAEISGTST